MSKKDNLKFNPALINALKEISFPIYDKKHNLYVYAVDDRARSNESRFEHIAKNHHELKVRDIEDLPIGIQSAFRFRKSNNKKGTYYYFYQRRGESKGFIQVSIQIMKNNPRKAYIKTIYVVYRIK